LPIITSLQDLGFSFFWHVPRFGWSELAAGPGRGNVCEMAWAEGVWVSSWRSALVWSVAAFFWLLSFGPASGADGPRWVVEEQRGEGVIYSEFAVSTADIWRQLDEVSAELEAATGIRGSGERVEVVLFASQSSYSRYLISKLPQARSRRAIFYRNGDVSQIYAWNNRSLMTDLRHEMVHVRVHQHMPYAPLWLDEGLAEYFEERRGSVGDKSRREMVRWKARLNQLSSLPSLERLPAAEAMGAEDYRNSWAWAAFFLGESEQSRGVLRAFVAEVHEGGAPGVFSAYAESRVPGLLSRGNSYFRKMPTSLSFGSSLK
jgi:hypothetical protein